MDAAGMPMVDLLLRKSKVVRDGERSLSIRAQEERGRRWAGENGYEVRHIWKENLSAWSDIERPKMDAALRAVLNGEVPALWCYAMDRFSRKGAESVVPVLGKARVIFDYERLDSMNERDRRWIIDRAEMAREYAVRLSYNVKGTKHRQRNEGRWLARPPYGLKVDPQTRRLSPDTEPRYCLIATRAEVSPWDNVERVFESMSGGSSTRALARKMAAEGHVTNSGGWDAGLVRCIIVHPVYEGWMTVGVGGRNVEYLNDSGERVRCVDQETLPLMIPAATALRARASSSGHNITPGDTRKGVPTHMLAGRIRCASCGGAMVAVSKSYKCQRYISGGPCVSPAMVYRSSVEEYVSRRWLARMEHSEDDDPVMLAVAERWQALVRPEESADVASARVALQAAQRALDKFHADDAAGFYEGRSAKYRMPHKREREERLTAAEERLHELTGGSRIDIGFLRHGFAEAAWETASSAKKRELIGLAVEYVTVTKAGKRGGRFDGRTRCVIKWAEPDEDM
ncbi:recombinase family protein [Streptomyces avermitilis]|uniref:recombinase family protein n=1 Tax=Streptomyces avermitilis TaxID=33903 RepID=UPI00381807E8